MIKVLWLTSWYPNQLDEWNGDFIQRQARAVSLYCNVDVIHVEADRQNRLQEPLISKENRLANLSETLVLFKSSARPWIGSITSFLRYKRLFKKEIKKHIKKNAVPDLVHVQVPMKAGIIAMWIKKKYKIPYIITEHWTIYDDNEDDAYKTRNFFFKRITKQIFATATLFLPVSESLGKLVSTAVLPVPYRVVYNVVDTRYFTYKPHRRDDVFTFIHVSTLNEQKNPEAIIEAFLAFHQAYPSSRLLMVGEVHGDLFGYVLRKEISQNAVSFTGLVPYHEVAEFMQQSDAFVLFSRYENMPCAVLEALCCGLPVISSNVGGLQEVINAENGILVNEYSKHVLTTAMTDLYNSHEKFNREKISLEAAAKFSFGVIGKQIENIYEEILHDTSEKNQVHDT